MKESKDEAILPCYRDGYGVWHYSDYTHEKVYELNRQMCDLDIPLRDPIKPLSEETAQELIGKWEKIGKEWASKKKEIVDENKSEEEKALDKISCLGAQIVDILLHMKGHHHVTITETDVILYDEGMSLFYSDLF